MPLSIDKSKVTVLSTPYGVETESYRTLRINIEFSAAHLPIKTIAVTSSQRGEGKTTTILNLAVAYAQTGKKVVLVDGDLRQPSIQQYFDGDNLCGLTNVLNSQSTINEAVKTTDIDHLCVITSGPISSNPAELLASERMDELCKELKQNFDVILFDTPPAVGLVDARIVSAKCDGVLLVLEQGKVKRATARRARKELTAVRANVLGVVLNKMNKKEAAVYR